MVHVEHVSGGRVRPVVVVDQIFGRPREVFVRACELDDRYAEIIRRLKNVGVQIVDGRIDNARHARGDEHFDARLFALLVRLRDRNHQSVSKPAGI